MTDTPLPEPINFSPLNMRRVPAIVLDELLGAALSDQRDIAISIRWAELHHIIEGFAAKFPDVEIIITGELLDYLFRRVLSNPGLDIGTRNWFMELKGKYNDTDNEADASAARILGANGDPISPSASRSDKGTIWGYPLFERSLNDPGWGDQSSTDQGEPGEHPTDSPRQAGSPGKNHRGKGNPGSHGRRNVHPN